MLLDVEDVHVHYGKAEALCGISLSIEEGRIVTLVGANGAGKSTTLRTISGLKRPSSGRISYKGERIDGRHAHEIVGLGIAHVPEGRMVFANMTVEENLEMGAYLRKDKRSVANDLKNVYERFPVLGRRTGQLAGLLSGGEQQMLAMARALMASPQVVLMDEPSMGLSPIFVDEIGRIIRTINEAGTSIVLVEQNARMALDLADYAYVIELGKISLHGTGKDLADNPEVQKAFLGG
jgi:branched-chain amino acid transport system ATP-binding protein